MKVNISIDDVSPHPRSSINVLKQCYFLIDQYPDIKFSLFVPIAYWRTVRPEIATNQPLIINRFPDFCDALRNLPSRNFEVCYHGLYHGIPGKNDNDEFETLTKEEALQKFEIMHQIVKNSNLDHVFKPIFRPPAWRMSPGSIEAAKEAGFEILALSPKERMMSIYAGKQEIFDNVIYYNCNPPFDPLETLDKNEIVYHACEWDKNYLSTDMTRELSEWLGTQSDLDFCFMKDMT
jgi:predicted deacetylase